MATTIKTRAVWKPAKIDPRLLLGTEEGGFISLQELTEYDLVTAQSGKVKDAKKSKKKNKKSKQSLTADTDSQHGKQMSQVKVQRGDSATPSNKPKAKPKKRKKSTPGRISSSDADVVVNVETTEDDSAPGPDERQSSKKIKHDMSAWKPLHVPDPVLSALDKLGFTTPTPIQVMALPSAIRDRMDIVGAAETGSGKTLAFAIPLIHGILRHRELVEQTRQDSGEEEMDEEEDDETSEQVEEDEDEGTQPEDDDNNDDEEDEEAEELEEDSDCDLSPSEEELGELPEGATGCVNVFNDVKFDWLKEVVPRRPVRPLYGLVLTPTRELAIQVRDHIKAVVSHTDIQVAAVVGGMAAQKQERLLKKGPEIVVATPGRLWELIEAGDPHLSQVNDIKCLVIDEADRMIEKGHFEELSKLLLQINEDEAKKKRRQTFVFSATLTMVHSGPHRLFKKKKKKKALTAEDKLEALVGAIGIKPRHKVIDLSRKAGTAEMLTEARINCRMEEKDFFLYYFLKQYPGRTLLFANSKDCIRRLTSVCKLLQVCPLALHADMHQKQRLKNLDKFKGNPRGLLLATDVAARGLDIPDVQHVLHYQVPRTTENYVHRSGRTARASKQGLSVMFVGPEDLQNYRKIIKTLNRDEDLPLFPVETNYMNGVKERINLARDIDQQEHRFDKKKAENNWFKRSAREMDIELDEDMLMNDLGDSREQAVHRQTVEAMRAQLRDMLSQPLIPQSFSGRYPTKTGKLVLPYIHKPEVGDAVKRVKQERKVEQKLLAKYPQKPKKKAKKDAALQSKRQQKKMKFKKRK